MIAAEMKPSMRYRVAVKSRNWEFAIGDQCAIDGDGSIINYTENGWIEKSDVLAATAGAIFEIDREWMERTNNEVRAVFAMVEGCK